MLIPIPSPPAAPSGLEFTVTGQTVTLSWRAAPGTTDYIVEAGSVSGASDFFNGPVGPVVSITATLPRGRYFVRLRGRNDAGVGPPSPEVLIDIGSGSSLPGVPRELTWSIVAAGTVRLVWQPVSGATDYSVEAGSTTGTADLFNGSVGAVPGLTARVPPGSILRPRPRQQRHRCGPRSEEVVIDVP